MPRNVTTLRLRRRTIIAGCSVGTAAVAAVSCSRTVARFVGTVSEAIDLIGQYQNAGVQLLINSDYRNDMETHELFASEVIPHFA